jgi:DNA replication protein DnaC
MSAGYCVHMKQCSMQEIQIMKHTNTIIITSNLPFDEWTEVFGAERLTGAILDRLTHHVHILEMNGESFRLRQSRINKT